MTTPHVKVQVTVEPGESREIEARLRPGDYRLRTLEIGGEQMLSYGGEAFPDNPLGRGHAPIPLADGRLYHPLPNVEAPGHLISSTGSEPKPAGFMPLDFTWPFRMGKAGTYDEAWVKERFPGETDLPPLQAPVREKKKRAADEPQEVLV